MPRSTFSSFGVSLLVLNYHRASRGGYGNTAEMFDAHFGYIARNYHCVLPGESLDRNRLNVCLSFDDGYFEFCAVIDPLLEEHGLRALLAIAPVAVREGIDQPGEGQLKTPGRMNPVHLNHGGFCTWSDLHELTQSGRVAIAAHGYTHRRLDQPGVDLQAEIDVPQTLLTARLGRPVNCFVFPYGRFSPPALQRAIEVYRYVFCNGNAANESWDGRLFHRIDAGGLSSPGELFKPVRMAGYQIRAFWNRVGGQPGRLSGEGARGELATAVLHS